MARISWRSWYAVVGFCFWKDSHTRMRCCFPSVGCTHSSTHKTRAVTRNEADASGNSSSFIPTVTRSDWIWLLFSNMRFHGNPRKMEQTAEREESSTELRHMVSRTRANFSWSDLRLILVVIQINSEWINPAIWSQVTFNGVRRLSITNWTHSCVTHSFPVPTALIESWKSRGARGNADTSKQPRINWIARGFVIESRRTDSKAKKSSIVWIPW